MALMRNLRNILQANVDDATLKTVVERISNPHEILQAKQFPFRYLSAYKELENVASINTPIVLDALEKAALESANNIMGFDSNTKVMLACDMSGSMQCAVSRNSKTMLYEVGNMLAMLLQSQCKKVISGFFASEWRTINYPHTSVLSNTCSNTSRVGEVGYGTQGGKPLEWLIKEEIKIDKVMFFTDCQFWDSQYDGNTFFKLWEDYKSIAPNAQLYLFDLAGYEHSPIDITRRDVTIISGWSERIFDIIDSINNAEDSLNKIKDIVV
jgi:hypothetical protein